MRVLRAMLAGAAIGCGGTTPGLDATGPDPADQVAGQVVRYRLDTAVGSVVASEPAGLEGSCSSCPVPIAGVHGGALSFTGTEVVALPGSLIGVTPYTVSVWILTDPTGALMAPMAKPQSPSNIYDVFMLLVRPNALPTYETTHASIAELMSPPVGPVLDDGRWHHLATTWDGTQKALYMDGSILDATLAIVEDGGTSIGLGTDVDTGIQAFAFHGGLDDLRIYGRAVTPAEVRLLAGLAPLRGLP